MAAPNLSGGSGGDAGKALAEARTWDLFRSVFWPAAAGNVLWALINTVLFALSNGKCLATLPYVLILVVLGGYLSVEWSRNLTGVATMKNWYSFAAVDGAHLVLICAAAIAVTPVPPPTDGHQPLDASLVLAGIMVVFYLVTAGGHLCNVWNFEGLRTQDDAVEKRRYKFCAAANPLLGAALSFGIACATPPWRGADLATANWRMAWECWAVLVLTFRVSLYRHSYWQPDATKRRIEGRATAAANTQAERDKAAQDKAAQEKAAQEKAQEKAAPENAAAPPTADAPPPPAAG